MPTKWIRRGAAVLAVCAVAAIAVVAATGAAATDNAVHAQALHVTDAVAADAVGPWQTVQMPPEVRAVIDRRNAEADDNGQGVQSAPAQDLIHVQDFEDETFPPDGWDVIDRNVGTGEDAVWAWGRQTCENKPDSGSTAGAWSNGGGTSGDQLTCWTPYDGATDTWIVYTGVDATSYAGGLRVLFDAKVDPPVNEAFRMCWSSAQQMQPSCRTYNITGANLVDKWWYPATPEIGDAAGHSDVAIMFWYEDDAADAGKKGAIVDNIMIEGLTTQSTPTPTQGEQTAVPTVGPTHTPIPEGQAAYMPLVLMKYDVENMLPVPTVEPAGVSVQLGHSIDDETGDLHAPGDHFQWGLEQMGRMIEWEGQQIDTELRWQWYFKPLDEGAEYQEIPGTINNSGRIQAESGRIGQQIILTNNQTGERLPLPRGYWRCDVWIGDITPGRAPDDSSEAVINDDVPNGATPVIPPTSTPTVEPTETLEPGTWGCEDLMANGDFEQGAQVGWKMWSNLQNSETGEPVPIDAVIVDNSQFPGATNPPAPQGEWFAQYFAVQRAQFVLYQDTPVEAVDASRYVSSTVTFWMGFDSKEVPDGEPNDTFQPVLVIEQGEGQPPSYYPILETPLSEESHENKKWMAYSVNLDSTTFWTNIANNPGQLFLGFLIENDDVPDTETYFGQDVSTFDVCLRNADMSAGTGRAIGSGMPAPVILQANPNAQMMSLDPVTQSSPWVATLDRILEFTIDR